jgi:DNA-binding IclR family transcriptional regulator
MTDKRRGIQSVEIGFKVLECLEQDARAMSLSELAQASGMSASRVQFYLVSFMRVGMVVQDGPGGRYWLGPAAIRLGLTALSHMDVLEAARARMPELQAKTGGTVYASVWGSHGPTIVNRLHGLHLVPLEVRMGAAMPLLTTATGRVFLAYMPRDVTMEIVNRELVGLRGRGGEPVRIDEMVAEVRTHGMSHYRGGLITGFTGIAAPVFDHQPALCSVITVTGSEAILDTGYDGKTARLLAEVAHATSQACGYTGEKWPPLP